MKRGQIISRKVVDRNIAKRAEEKRELFLVKTMQSGYGFHIADFVEIYAETEDEAIAKAKKRFPKRNIVSCFSVTKHKTGLTIHAPSY